LPPQCGQESNGSSVTSSHAGRAPVGTGDRHPVHDRLADGGKEWRMSSKLGRRDIFALPRKVSPMGESTKLGNKTGASRRIRSPERKTMRSHRRQNKSRSNSSPTASARVGPSKRTTPRPGTCRPGILLIASGQISNCRAAGRVQRARPSCARPRPVANIELTSAHRESGASKNGLGCGRSNPGSPSNVTARNWLRVAA